MRPTNRFFLFALITFFLFGTVPTVNAQEPIATPTAVETIAPDFASAEPVSCSDPEVSKDHSIDSPGEVDVYIIDGIEGLEGLVAGQVLTIDVDTADNGKTLDTILHVYADIDPYTTDDTEIPIISSDYTPSEDPENPDEDPYLEFTIDKDGIYYLVIYDALNSGSTGSYTLSLKCTEPSTDPVKDVEIGDLLGATSDDPGSIVTILPEDSTSTTRFHPVTGPIADIEYQHSSHKLFVSIGDNPGSIIAMHPDSGEEELTYSLAAEDGTVPTIVALEAAEDVLYGIQVDPNSENHNLVLVTLNDIDLTATLTLVFSFDTQQVRGLAYHSVEKVIYGLASIASKSNLIKIHLEPELLVETTNAIPIVDKTSGEPVNVVSLDFSHENFLFGVDLLGNLHEIDHTNGQAVSLGEPTAKVSSLTFVVGAAPGGVDPVGTICSSTLTTSASTSSGTADPKLSRFKLKKNPLHRAIGLFKFEGMQGETVTLNVELDGIESAEAVAAEESTASSELQNSLMNHWKGKGRVFLGIRDAIPGLDFRERKKEHIPFDMSATLPADGTYYVMLIRPLLRYYQTDYCLSLTSDLQEDSQAWKTFEVAWPNDESGDDTACTTAEESKDVQNDTETLAGASADDGSVSVTLSTTAIAPTSAPPEEPVVETPVEADPAAEGGDTEGGQTLAETPVVEPVAETPVAEPVAEIPVVEPVAEIPVVEPVVETPVVEPVVETPVVEPVAETPVVEPVVETPVVEPVAEIPVVTEPAAGGTTTEELIEPVVEAPADTDPDGVGVR